MQTGGAGRPHWLAAIVLSATACASPAAPFVARAKDAEASQKLEESAAQLEAICVVAPGKDCDAARAKAIELRATIAKKAMDEGRYLEAERALLLAMLTDSIEARKEAGERLASDEMKQGLAFERALRSADKDLTRAALTPIAATSTKVATRAKAWLDEDAPRGVVASAKLACGEAHEGSCTKAAVELRALTAKSPEVEAALALVLTEERRVYPLRVEAERFLVIFAARRGREKQAEDCSEAENRQGGGPPTPERLLTCRQNLMADDTYDRTRNDQVLFRRLLAKIADRELVDAIRERQKTAEADGSYTKLELPKPPKEKK